MGTDYPPPKTQSIVSSKRSSLSWNFLKILSNSTDIQNNKPVGFYGRIAPPVPNAPISECANVICIKFLLTYLLNLLRVTALIIGNAELC